MKNNENEFSIIYLCAMMMMMILSSWWSFCCWAELMLDYVYNLAGAQLSLTVRILSHVALFWVLFWSDCDWYGLVILLNKWMNNRNPYNINALPFNCRVPCLLILPIWKKNISFIVFHLVHHFQRTHWSPVFGFALTCVPKSNVREYVYTGI